MKLGTRLAAAAAVVAAFAIEAAAAERFWFRPYPAIIVDGAPQGGGPSEPEPGGWMRIESPSSIAAGTERRAFALFESSVGWRIVPAPEVPSFVQVHGLGRSMTFTPQAQDVGTHMLRIWAENSDGREDSVTFPLEVTPAGSGYPEASRTMAASATLNGAAVDHTRLYERDDRTVVINAGGALVVDFGQTVAFQRIFAEFLGQGSSLEFLYEMDGEWVYEGDLAGPLEGSIGTSWSSSMWLQTPKNVSRVMARAPQGQAGSTIVRHLRIGGGPEQPAPRIVQEGLVAALGPDPQQVQLLVSHQSAYGEAEYSFVLEEGTLPPGADLTPDGVLHLPSFQGIDPGSWAFSVRLVDSFGFQSVHEGLRVEREGSASAAQVMATDVRLNQNAIDHRRFYDGSAAQVAANIRQGDELVFDFGQTVTFDEIYYESVGTARARAFAEVDGTWVDVGAVIGTSSSSNGSGYVSTDAEVSTRRVRFIREGWSADNSFREIRIGGGAAHPGPRFQPHLAAELGSVPQQVQLAATQDTPYGPVEYTWQRMSGELPAGAVLSPDGTLDLPAADAAAGSSWAAVIRVTDSLGFHWQELVRVHVRQPDASGFMPVSVFNEGTHQGAGLQDHRFLYDGETTGITVRTTARNLDVDMGRPVTMRRFHLQTGSLGRLDMEVHARIGGAWINTGVTIGNGSTMAVNQSFDLGSDWTAREFRFRNRNSTFDVVLQGLRLGDGAPVHARPQMQDPPLLGAMHASPRTVQLQALAGGTHYSQEPLVFSLPEGKLPSGSHLHPDGRLDLPSGSGLDPAYEFTVRVTDGAGFWDERRFLLLNGAEEAPPAQQGFSQAQVFRDIQPAPVAAPGVVFDDNASTAVAGITSSLVLDFGTHVKADRFHRQVLYREFSQGYRIEYELAGQWVAMENVTGVAVGTVQTAETQLAEPVVARRFRIVTNGLNGLMDIREFRPGYGSTLP